MGQAAGACHPTYRNLLQNCDSVNSRKTDLPRGASLPPDVARRPLDPKQNTSTVEPLLSHTSDNPNPLYAIARSVYQFGGRGFVRQNL